MMKEADSVGLKKAALLMLTGMGIIGLIDNFVVFIANETGLWQFHLTRSAMALPMIAVLARIFGQTIRPKRFWAVGVRSILMSASMVIYFGAIPLMPISTVIACMFTAPIFVLIFSVVFLRMRVGWVRVGAVVLGFFGVVLVLDPREGINVATILPVIAGALYAMNTMAVRHLCEEESTFSLLFGFFLFLGFFGGLGMMVFSGGMEEIFPKRGYIAPTSVFLALVLVQAMGAIVAVGCLTRAYQMYDPSFLASFEYSLLVFASIWAYVLYGTVLTGIALVGMGFIALSGVIIVRRGNRTGENGVGNGS